MERQVLWLKTFLSHKQFENELLTVVRMLLLLLSFGRTRCLHFVNLIFVFKVFATLDLLKHGMKQRIFVSILIKKKFHSKLRHWADVLWCSFPRKQLALNLQLHWCYRANHHVFLVQININLYDVTRAHRKDWTIPTTFVRIQITSEVPL